MQKIPMIVTLIFILIGTLIQFIDPSEGMYFVGLLLIVLVPPTVSLFSDTTPKFDGEVIEKWHKLRPEETDDVLEQLTHPKAYNVLERNFFEKLFSFYCSIGMLIIAIFVSFGYILDEAFVMGALIADAVAIPRALHFIIYGKSPAGVSKEGKSIFPIREQMKAVNVLRTLDTRQESSETAEDKFNFITEVKLCKGADVKVTDIRLQVDMKEKYRDLLCAMVSISKNSVQSVYYPYAYYVIVLKGTNQQQGLLQQLDAICNDTVFRCEANVNDGNRVFVYTKKMGSQEYTTSPVDCKALYMIISRSTIILDRFCK